MSTDLQISLEQQIARLELEVATQQSDVRSLQEAIATIETNKPRPATPSADNAFELLRQLVGSVPENLEQEQLYRAKLAEAQRALELAIASVEQKQLELDDLRQEQRSQQQEEAFERLKSKAEMFNQLIDKVMGQLQEMRSLALVAGSGRFEVVADIREMPYCSITASSVKIRRRVDIRQG